MTVLTICGKKYARNKAEFVSSLFDAGGTCVGHYKPVGSGIQIMDMQQKVFAYLVVEREKHTKTCFFVSAGRTPNGRVFYAFGLSGRARDRLGLTAFGYAAEREEAERAYNECDL